MIGEPDVAVVIVSYNTVEDTLRCVGSVVASVGVTVQVVVVDNASSDGSADRIASDFPELTVIRRTTNAGFGAACNEGVAWSRSDVLLFLNPDCFVLPDTIAICLMNIRASECVAAVACQLRHPDGSVQRSCRRFPTLASEAMRVVLPFQLARHLPVLGGYHYGRWRHDTRRIVAQPAAAFLLVRRSSLGGHPPFDPRFFMYYEDVDLCRRLADSGEVWFTAETHAIHIGEKSTSALRVEMAQHLARSRHLYFEKWHGRGQARLVDILGALGSSVRSLYWGAASLVRPGDSVRSRSRAHRAAAACAFRLCLGDVPIAAPDRSGRR